MNQNLVKKTIVKLISKGLGVGKYTLEKVNNNLFIVNGNETDNSQLNKVFDLFATNKIEFIIYKNGDFKLFDLQNEKEIIL